MILCNTWLSLGRLLLQKVPHLEMRQVDTSFSNVYITQPKTRTGFHGLRGLCGVKSKILSEMPLRIPNLSSYPAFHYEHSLSKGRLREGQSVLLVNTNQELKLRLDQHCCYPS